MKLSPMSPLAVYTLARLTLFVVVLMVVAAFGARGALALGLAVVVSMLLSYPLLAKLRVAASQTVADRVGHRLNRGTAEPGEEAELESDEPPSDRQRDA